MLLLAAYFLMINNTCNRCQATFDCSGCTTGACWCMGYPAIFSCVATDAAKIANDCVCPKCLTAMTKAHIAQTIDLQIIHTTAPAEALACQGQPLIEGLDYTIENGLWVFSRWYFLKRGECCGNACRNCPYGHVNVKKITPKIMNKHFRSPQNHPDITTLLKN